MHFGHKPANQIKKADLLDLIESKTSEDAQSAAQILPSVGFEEQIFKRIRHGKALLQSLFVECPMAIMVSFTGIKGWRMGMSPEYSTWPVNVFDRDPLLNPEILIETFDGSPVSEMRPIVDAIWNAAGWPGSPHYDELGNWDKNR